MIVVLLGLATGVAYGVTDFCAGLAARRASSSLAVVAVLEVGALAALAATVPLSGEAPEVAPLVWGAAAGAAIGLGNIAYFRGLAVGHMGVVAALTAVCGALVPVAAGLALGDRPRPVAWVGMAIILVAIVLVTYVSDATRPARPAGSPAVAVVGAGLPEALAAGLGFGLYFTAISQATASSGALAWPLLAAAAVAAALVVSTAAALRVDWRPAVRQWPLVGGAALLYAAGSWAFIVGTSRGWVSIVSVLAAISPAPTIVLARMLLHEVLTVRQLVGVGLAVAGVAFVSLGLPA